MHDDDEDMPGPLREEMFRLALFDQARHRKMLMACAKRCWGIAERGPISWLGDACDEIEWRLRLRRARRNLPRKSVRGGA